MKTILTFAAFFMMLFAVPRSCGQITFSGGAKIGGGASVGTSSASFPVAPAWATEMTNLQNVDGNPGEWKLCQLPGCNPGGNDGGTGTSAFGIASPSLSGSAMSITATSGDTGYYDLLAYRHVGCAFLPGATCVQNSFNGILAFWFYIPSSSANLQDIEFPSIQLFDGTWHISTTTQGNIAAGVWKLWDSGTGGWHATTYPFTLPSYDTWHYAQEYISYNGSLSTPTVTYHNLSIDGVPVSPDINQTFNAESYPTSTGMTVGIQQQIDNNSTASASNTVYFDSYNAWFWSNDLTAPTASPAAGTYSSAQTVTLSGQTGTTIHYTTDGSTPTGSSPIYSSPLSIATTTTVKAIATASGGNDSPVFSGTWTITIPTAATPTASPAAGTYSSAQSVSLSSTTSGATICYTTDGSAPAASTPGTCSAGTTYSTAISVASSLTIKALATKSGYTNSGILSAAYTITGGGSATVILCPNGSQVGNYANCVQSADPNSLAYQMDFGKQGTGTSSMALPVSINNCSASLSSACTGTGSTTVTAMSITGTNASDFEITGTCGTIASGGNCKPTITFSPSASAGTTETATFSETDSSGTHTLPLTGVSTTETALSSSACPSALAAGNYQLTADISCAEIAFTTDATVDINLNGHTITYGTTTTANQIGGIDVSGGDAGTVTVHNGTLTQGTGVNTFWDGETPGTGEATSSVLGGTPSGYNPNSPGAWILSNLTINYHTQFAAAVIANGSAITMHDVTIYDAAVGTCAEVGCRAEAQSYPIFQYNAESATGTLKVYNVSLFGSAQGGVSWNSIGGLVVNNYLNPGNASGTNSNDFAIQEYGKNAIIENNIILTPITADSGSRGIMVSGAGGYGSGNTVTHNTVGSLERAVNAEAGGCEGAGGYDFQYDDNPPGPNTVSYNTNTASNDGCVASGLRISDNADATNTTDHNTWNGVRLSGATACATATWSGMLPGCVAAVSIDGPAAANSTADTFISDSFDIFVDTDGGNMTFNSPTFNKGSNPSTFHFIAAQNGPVGSGTIAAVLKINDATFGTGVSPTDLFSYDQGANTGPVSAYINWTQTMQVNKASGPAASGAVVTWTDTLGNPYTCTTNGSGACSVLLTQYRDNNDTTAGSVENRNPYSLSVTASGCTADSETEITVSATGTKTVSLSGC